MSGADQVFELRPQPWMAEAKCVDADPELFFPQRGESTAPAKAICQACPVRAACLDYALSINERNGIWGGTSERERRQIRRQMDALAGATWPKPRREGTGSGSDGAESATV